jgi:hypothetical protein
MTWFILKTSKAAMGGAADNNAQRADMPDPGICVLVATIDPIESRIPQPRSMLGFPRGRWRLLI